MTPKFVILGSCRHEPYEILQMPNPFDRKLYVEDHEKAYEEACKRFYPAIDEADVVIVYAPNGVGEHTKQDIEYAKSRGKPVILIDKGALEP